MTILTEQLPHSGGFLIEEFSPEHNREEVTIASGEDLRPGAVLGKVTLGTATATADGGNTGDGTMSSVTVAGAAQAGDYTLNIVEAATDGGRFEVRDPAGDVVGLGAVGTAFTGGGLTFTLSDGATDFAVGDTFTIAVAEGSGKYVEYDNAGADGRNIAAGILYAAVDASSADATGAAIVRGPATVTLAELVFASGQDAAAQTAAVADLEALGIIAR